MDNKLIGILSKWEQYFFSLRNPDGSLLTAGSDGLGDVKEVSLRAESPLLLLAWLSGNTDCFSAEVSTWAENKVYPYGLPF
jgi:hypothetical protein